MHRNNFSIRRNTTEAQKNPNQSPGKICAHILTVRQLRKKISKKLRTIFASDETAVWNDMVSNTAVEKRGAYSVNRKSTGHEKAKITVCF